MNYKIMPVTKFNEMIIYGVEADGSDFDPKWVAVQGNGYKQYGYVLAEFSAGLLSAAQWFKTKSEAINA